MKVSPAVGATIGILFLGGVAVVFLWPGERPSGFSSPNFRLPASAGMTAVSDGESDELPPPVVPEGWLRFENEQFDFSVYVPPGLKVSAFDEGGGAHTFTFEDAESGYGFQIFVVPYGKSSITPERFRKDAPSGVMNEPIDVLIGGVPARAFFGEANLMGETREVWFIRNGLLYEVTTYKQLDTWLADIMNTWRFIP
jgi:hypothetical protein